MMFSRSKAQLSPRRSHFYVDTDLLDGEDDRLAMIYVVSVQLDSIKERWVGSRNRKKQYAFVLNMKWSDGSSSIIWRSYNDFFDFQCGLLDSFPEEAGSVRGFVRIIPYLPGINSCIFNGGKGVTKSAYRTGRICSAVLRGERELRAWRDITREEKEKVSKRSGRAQIYSRVKPTHC